MEEAAQLPAPGSDEHADAVLSAVALAKGVFGPPNVLPLSRVRPYRTRLRDATRRADRAAEAAGQTTAARRLLRRVGRRFMA